MSVTYILPDEADYKARVFVCGMTDEVLSDGTVIGKKVVNSGHWSPRFASHPWVADAEREGWGRDLRSAVVAIVRRRIMAKVPYHAVEELMPSAEWVTAQRKRAASYAAADGWRAEMVEKHGDMDRFLAKTKGKAGTARPLGSFAMGAFRAMQAASPNRKRLHTVPDGLSGISRRMTGETE